jgi:hypothetical protein
MSGTAISGSNNNGVAMSASDVNTLISQQVQIQTAALTTRINELEDKNRQLEKAVLQHENGHNVGQQNGHVHGGTMKAAKPAMYNGEMGSDVEAWLFQILQYAYITNIPEENRAKWAATYLTGKAATWWRGMVMQTAEGDIDAITWDQFYKGLVSMFKPVNAKKIARDKLAALKQTHSVAKYNYDISQLFLEIGDIHESEKLDRYVRGLKDKIRLEVELTEPTTLTQAMAKAQRVDGITYHSRMMQDMGSAYHNTYTTSANDSNAMDVSMVDEEAERSEEELNAVGNRNNGQANRIASRANPNRLPISREVFKYCQERRLCLRCKEPGHIARVCSKPVKPLNVKAH